MTEKEIDVVAEELARLGGSSWYPGRGEDPVLRVITQRYRERARAAIAALDRFRAGIAVGAPEGESIAISISPSEGERLRLGATVIYRPSGDRRAYSCIVDQVGEGRVHVIPQLPGGDGWIQEPRIVTDDVVKDLEEQGLTPKGLTRQLPEAGQSGEQSRS